MIPIPPMTSLSAASRSPDGSARDATSSTPSSARPTWGLQEVAIAVDLGDAGRALRAAAAVDTSGLSAERRARLLIETARAHAQRRQAAEAVATLLQAEQITPELVRGHPLVRQLVSDLLTMLDPPGAELRDLARRLTAKHETGT